MAKIISVCGSPNCGKTTAALKIAMEIYGLDNKKPVLFLSPDLNVPCLAYIFPHAKDSELYSVGVALDKTEVYREDVMRQINNIKTLSNFGFLGFKSGENRYSYPAPTEDKILGFFQSMKDIAEYVVIDCTSGYDDLISQLAKSHADTVIQMVTPDLKCMSYYASCAEQFEHLADRRIKVMNLVDVDLFLPIGEVSEHFHGIDFTLPYSRALKQQTITGTLSERIPDAAYRGVAKEIAKAVI